MSQNSISSSSATKGGRARIERLESGVCVLRLGAPDERVVTITAERMRSIGDALKELRSQRPLGLIIAGPHADMFTAGADINLIRDVTDPSVGERLALEGQEVFNDLESLPFPTVAAISGPCVGGGCEMVLACKYRIISDNKSSLIGLPEVKLGILPGFGGTQRLPRLVGLPKALDIILAGKTLKAKQARSAGLVDAIVPFDQLIALAEKYIVGTEQPERKKPKFMDRLLTNTGFGRNMVRKNATASVRKETKGFYPAPPAALEAALFGLEKGIKAGLEHEAKELGRLIVTPESKSLVHLFFLTESAKAIGKGAKKAVEQVHAMVVGAGVMGAGIAGTLARNDCSVILKDTSDAAVQRGVEHIKKQLSKSRSLSEQERSFILNRVEATAGDSANAGNVNIAIEAIFEEMSAKQKLFNDLNRILPKESILATNTSSLSVTEMARGIEHPERVVGMHFFNPVEKMPLIEIVLGKQTSDKTAAIVAALTSKLGKFPIIVQDVPGFLVNRILTPYLNEAAFMLSEGFAIETIDKAAVRFGMPMGPVRLLDEVGLDVAAHVLETMVRGYGERMESPALLPMLVAAKRLGRKNGAGFYDFAADEAKPHPNIRQLLKINVPLRTTSDLSSVSDRLVMRLINEGIRCLDEGVAGAPGAEAANQIDLGTVMGMGFPPFRGGLVHYAQQLGPKRVAETLEKLAKEVHKRFEPSPGILKRAQTGKSFYEAM